jgi:hypothetical protein
MPDTTTATSGITPRPLLKPQPPNNAKPATTVTKSISKTAFSKSVPWTADLDFSFGF